MTVLRIIWLVLFAGSFCAIGIGIGSELNPPQVTHVVSYQTEYVDKWQIVERTVEVPVFIDREVPQIITVETTVEIPTYPSLRYFDNLDELLNFFYHTDIDFDDCDNMAEIARRAAEAEGYYLGEVVIIGSQYNKIFIDNPMPPAIYHAINFTWVGNDGYYVDFMIRDVKKAPDFVRD